MAEDKSGIFQRVDEVTELLPIEIEIRVVAGLNSRPLDNVKLCSY